MKKKQIAAMLMAGAMCMGMLAGCGNKDNTGSGDATAFTVGVVGPLTGDAAIYGTNVVNAAQIAVDEINALGGDIQFKLISADDVNDPETSVNAYNKLMDKGLQLLVGTVTSKPALSVSPLANEDRVFTLTPSASGDDVIEGNDNTYQVCFTDSNQGSPSSTKTTIPIPRASGIPSPPRPRPAA